MPSIQEQVGHNLRLIDQATEEGRACRVTLHNGMPVVETSPKEFLKKTRWKFTHRRNKVAEKKLRDMVINVIEDSHTSLSLRRQIFDGAKDRRYTFFSDRAVRAIVKNEALMLSPAPMGEPVPSKPLPKRRVKLLDAMKFTGPARQLPDNPGRHRFADAMKSSGPAKIVHKRPRPEMPPIPYTPPTIIVTPPTEEDETPDSLTVNTPPTIIVTPPTEEAETPDSLTLNTPPTIIVTPPTEEAETPDSLTMIDFESTPLVEPRSDDALTPPPATDAVPYKPIPVKLPEGPPDAPVFQIYGPLSLASKDQIVRPIIFPKAPLQMLEEARQELESKLPSINLADADQFLWLYYTCEFLEQITADSSDELKAQLEQSFAAAGLSSHYNKRQTEQMWQAVRKLKIDMSPEAFSECIDEMSEISTPMRFKLTQHLVRDINELSFRKVPHPNGDPAIRVDAFQLEFLEQVKATDELMEDLGFEIDDPDESDYPLEARANLVDVREKLEDELLTYSTEHESFAQLVDQLKEVDPIAIREKVSDGKTPTQEELQAIIAAKKQKLEVARHLGRKWGDSLLLDGRNWPDDDARQTLSKLYDLASLNSPVIDAHLNQWILDKHHEAEYHPQVVIDGSDIHGLLAALTQVEAGADVTLLLSVEPLHTPTGTLRLDPQWMEALRFYLGSEFDSLFTRLPAHEQHSPQNNSPQNNDKNSGRLDPDGFGEISADTLHQALWAQVLDMARLDSSPLQMVSNTGVVDIEAPDQQDGKYLVHLEHQDEQNAHSNKVPVDLLINADAVPNAASAGYLETESVDNAFHEAVKGEPFKPPKRIACRCEFSLPQSPTLIEPPAKSPFNVTVVDPSFSDALVKHLRARLGHEAPALPGVRKNVLAGIRLNLIERKGKEGFENNRQYLLSEELEKLHLAIKNKPLPLKTVHTESRQSIQIDMELPRPLCQFLQAAEASLQYLATPEESGAIRREILAAWFETVAERMELPKRGIRPEHLRQESLSTFSPVKTVLSPAVETLESDNSILTLTAIGAAAIKKPLYPEAGQTSAREHVFHCQALTEKLSEHHTPEGHLKDPENLLEDTEDMEQEYGFLQNFVLKDD
ncbi:hypothetical protein [Endozoicomonas sp. SESOKO2]|uniref:hypothetical protein n=1 Tax=Endozoicomonas sp. SESOKO2 TaxID=2828743 RepID=UPI002148D498|nr:hypothetical protein [Endozoicomonas sp. SESOKO2]